MANTKDKRQQLLVWGYIRNLESIHKLKSIPYEINDIIYLYQEVFDRWSTEYLAEQLTLNEDKSIVTCNENHNVVTAFGDTSVEQGIFKWCIEMTSLHRTKHDGRIDGPFIGIIEDKPEFMKQFKNDACWQYHGYQIDGKDGMIYTYSNNNSYSIKDRSTQCLWKKEGDILELKLDLNQATLSAKVNDTDIGVLFEGIAIKRYRLAMSMCQEHGSKFSLY